MTKKSAASRPAAATRAKTPDIETRGQRADGAEARNRLIEVALRLFVDKGFARTSTRDIAAEAGVNLAAIKYYFGDKAGLYRAVFTEPLAEHCGPMLRIDEEGLTLRESIERFLAGFFEPLKQTELIQYCIRLHFREMLEPTGLWMEEINNNIKPAHEALTVALMRHMGLKKEDDDVHRLAFSIAALAIQMFVSRDIIHVIRPTLIDSSAAIDQWAAHTVNYAEAMVLADINRCTGSQGNDRRGNDRRSDSVKKKKQ